MSRSGLLTNLRIAECRAEARKVLNRFHVTSPTAIDVETLAWLDAKLKVKTGGLTGSEGRLVATSGNGGVIRVASNQNPGRYRFTVGHEFGHYRLHQKNIIDKVVLKRDLGIWNKASEEAEANYFAAELLMPDYLFQSRCRGVPSISKLMSLAEEFRTSLLATAFQYWEYTSEPVALVLSEGWQMTSFRPFKDGWPRLRYGEIHEHSAAGERLADKSPDSNGMVETPAYAWLEGFDDKPNSDIMEDSIYLEYYDTTITLLWIDKEL